MDAIRINEKKKKLEMFRTFSTKKYINPNSKELRELKAKLTCLTPELMEIAVGLALGDISIHTQNKGSTYRIRMGGISTRIMLSIFILCFLIGF
jgi:hypothetical protein